MNMLTRINGGIAALLLSTAVAVAAPASVRVPHAGAPPSLAEAGGWESAVHLTLAWDVTNNRATANNTDVALLSDKTALYVRFTVHQSSPVKATQTVNGTGEGTDDDVTVRLFPAGADGVIYSFRANPRGAHYQGASDRAEYAPEWTSIGSAIPGGYIVTMRVPFAALPKMSATALAAQFERENRTTGERDVWTHVPGDTNYLDAPSIGLLETLGT